MIKETLERFAVRFAIPIGLSAALGVSFLLAPQGVPLPLEDVIPEEGIELPVAWGDLGVRLVEAGAIDRDKFIALYGTLSEEQTQLLDGNDPERLRITRENALYLLNLFWALGLANANPILEDETTMMNPEYGGAPGFASTGGWILAQGEAMEHYGAHSLVPLTAEEQALVEKIARGVYRPCCDNSTYFPDCNHGMAMLGLLELMVSQGASEEEMWKAALAVNSYWFPDTYLTIAAYKLSVGEAWSGVDPKEVLGAEYSSATGYARIASLMAPRSIGGGSCSV